MRWMLALALVAVVGCGDDVPGAPDDPPPVAPVAASIVGSWISAPTLVQETVVFAPDGTFASQKDYATGATVTVPGFWTATDAQVTITRIASGAKTETLAYAVDGTRLTLGSAVYTRQP